MTISNDSSLNSCADLKANVEVYIPETQTNDFKFIDFDKEGIDIKEYSKLT